MDVFGYPLPRVITALEEIEFDVLQHARDLAEQRPDSPGLNELARVDASLQAQHIRATRMTLTALAEKLGG